ncbi:MULTISPECIES: MFS transporter [Corynebacterium]|uniref:MFS transporter n=1 Tax=Corynebacterium TaxID=1716 RepID=UPI0008A384BF|nr:MULTISPECIES: MFS transporter [Corynebacterium]OFT74596.1 MFS transporter [Corynebacterium sp. HMSC30G07]
MNNQPRTEEHTEERNARRFIWSNGLQNIGDQIVAPKTVLPWLFSAAGVPHVFTSLLVPVRESLSMLPQAFLSPWVTSQRSRKRVWLLGSWGQFAAAMGIAISALLFDATLLGLFTIILLAVHATFRSLCSIAGKDVQGRTISKGKRGEITGRATALAGAFTLAVGVGLMFVDVSLHVLLFAGAVTWALASLVFQSIDEPEPEDSKKDTASFRDILGLVKENKDLQRFLVVRSLMLVTALSTPFIVVLASQAGADLRGLGAFVIASGGASLLGGRISGLWSDRSSKLTMAWGAGVASVVLVLLVLSASTLPDGVNAWVMPLGFFLVNLAHTSVRVSRKTYLVDMAEGDTRTLITGASNTVMGIVLLAVGALSSAISLLGPQAALIFLAVVGVAGVVGASRLKDVSKR